MKLSAVLSIAALAQISLADFYLYHVKAGIDSGYQISDIANPRCKELGPRTPWYPSKSDVSGNKLGIRCKGDGCSGNNDPSKIDEMEMRFSNDPPYYWTIRRSQNYDLIAGDGAVQGRCYEVSGFNYKCASNDNKTDKGSRKLLCRVYASAAQIKAAK